MMPGYVAQIGDTATGGAKLENARRYRFLEENPAANSADWFPPTEACPELADLRAEHERLTGVVADRLNAAAERHYQRQAENEARRAAQERAFLSDEPEALPELTVSDDELQEAAELAATARDALQVFSQRAIAQVGERASDLFAGLDEIIRTADAKRAEAQAILAEADRMVGETKRMRAGLARTTGASPLGLYPFEQMAVPQPDSATTMTVSELYDAITPAFGMTELDGYGTDDPENLDTDSDAQTGEVAIIND